MDSLIRLAGALGRTAFLPAAEGGSPAVVVERRQALPLAVHQGQRVRCVDGRVWITLERDVRDFVLAPGDVLDLDHAGAVAYGLTRARLVIGT